MSARKLIYRFMVCTPALFLAGLGVHARGLSDGFEVVASDPASDQNIYAYVPYLRESEPFVPSAKFDKLKEARAAAAMWIRGAEEGHLKPLPPVAYEDVSSEGAKSQVFDTASHLTSCLLSSVAAAANEGKAHEAAIDAVLVLRLSQVLKYSDFVSLFNCATASRRALIQLRPVMAKLNEQDRQTLNKALSEAISKPQTIDRMVRRSRQLFLDWRERRGYQPLSIEDTQLLGDIPALVKGDNAVALREIRTRMLASKDNHIPTYCSSVRLGVGAQDLLDADIAATRFLLRKPAK